MDLGIGSRNSKYKFGDTITFNNSIDTNIEDNSVLIVESYDTYDLVNNRDTYLHPDESNKEVWYYIKIKQIMNVLYNFKYNKILFINIFYRDTNYPSKLSSYPWNMMFIFDRENRDTYYQTLENNGTKIKYMFKNDGFLTLTSQLNRWNFNFKVGNTFRINDAKNTGLDKKTILRYYQYKPMVGTFYTQTTISGEGV